MNNTSDECYLMFVNLKKNQNRIHCRESQLINCFLQTRFWGTGSPTKPFQQATDLQDATMLIVLNYWSKKVDLGFFYEFVSLPAGWYLVVEQRFWSRFCLWFQLDMLPYVPWDPWHTFMKMVKENYSLWHVTYVRR